MSKTIIEMCALEIGLTTREIVSIAYNAPLRYYVWDVQKRSGVGTRTLCHPARELKAIQNVLKDKVLSELPIHPAATAYVRGASIKRNAQAHVNSRVILKLDFQDFFNSIKIESWIKYSSERYPNWSEDERKFSASILFWKDKKVRNLFCLAIGAPTSPLIANALLYEIDEKLFQYARDNGICYTRYADDVTFSSNGFIDAAGIMKYVEQTLEKSKYTNLKLNRQKTRIVSNRYSRRVTGLILTPTGHVSLGRGRKRLIRAMVCRYKRGLLDEKQKNKLAGLIGFASDIEPRYVISLKNRYGSAIIESILRQRQ